MKKQKVQGWIYLGVATLILFYTGSIYRAGGMSTAFVAAMGGSILSVGIFYLAGYRRLGSIPAWAAMAAGLLASFIACAESGTALLLWALCCGVPLAVTFFWPHLPRIRPLAMAALPVASGIWLGGALLYNKLHFGNWALNTVPARIAEKYLDAVGHLEQIYAQIYPEGFPEQLVKMLEMIKQLDQRVGFFCIVFTAYALVGGFFLSVWAADRMAPKRWLGSWAALIPSRSLSWIFMLGYFFTMFLAEPYYTNVIATFHLFGFFYVFTALYVFLQFLRKKKVGAALCGLIIGGLLVLSYCSAGNSLISIYSLLMIVGLVIATAPRVMIIKKSP